MIIAIAVYTILKGLPLKVIELGIFSFKLLTTVVLLLLSVLFVVVFVELINSLINLLIMFLPTILW